MPTDRAPITLSQIVRRAEWSGAARAPALEWLANRGITV
jgi:hypothetical protein